MSQIKKQYPVTFGIHYVKFYTLIIFMLFISSMLFAQAGSYIRPVINNPHGATIEWEIDGSVKVTGGPVQFRSGIKITSKALHHEMLLLDPNTYNGLEQIVSYGAYITDISNDTNGSLKLGTYLLNSDDNYNYDVDNEDNNYLVYGMEYTGGFKSFENTNNPFKLEGTYIKDGTLLFNKREHLVSTDYEKLYNRPKKWGKTTTIQNAAVGIGLTGAVVSFVVSPTNTFKAVVKNRVGIGTGALAYGVYSNLHTGIASDYVKDDASGAFVHSPYSDKNEFLVPDKYSSPGNDEDKLNWNDYVDKIQVHSKNCSFAPGKQCYEKQMFRSVVQLDNVKDVHLKYVNIPGEIYKDLTPYQLFHKMEYVVDNTGELLVTGHLSLQNRESVFNHLSDINILPKQLVTSPIEQEVTVNFSNFEYSNTLYVVAENSQSVGIHENYARNLGIYGVLNGNNYYLYKYQFIPENTAHTFTTTPTGPFLAGDNITLTHTALPTLPVSIVVTKPDGTNRATYTFNSINDIETVACTMGDKVEFSIETFNGIPPEITNLPATWLTPIGREYFYHCDPSIVPGAIKPKIPFEIQSHYAVANYAPVEYYPDWEQDADNPNLYKLTWTAQRRTITPDEPNYRDIYQAEFKYKKADVHNGKTQRRSKSQGQIMDYLNIYNANKVINGNGYTYDATSRKYYWNLDSDEVLFFNTNEYNTHTPGWNGTIKRVPLYKVSSADDPYSTPSLALTSEIETEVASTYEPWQLIQEGDYTWSTDDGYPLSGFVANEMVNAYREFHDNTTPKYRGYEIEDFCLYKDDSGNCIESSGTTPGDVEKGAVYNREGLGADDNNKHPGLIEIFNGIDAFEIPLKVEAPLEVDEGFYGNIVTPQYSRAGADLPLTVVGLPKHMTTEEMSHYSLHLRGFGLQEYSDWHFKLSNTGHAATYNADDGTWFVQRNEMLYYQSFSATLYFTPDLTAEVVDPSDPANSPLKGAVIIGGSEWKNSSVFYLFTTTDDYGGTDCTDCLDLETSYEDPMDMYMQAERVKQDYSRGYTKYLNTVGSARYRKEYIRRYVLSKNDPKTRFASMDVLDNIWDMHGQAYYWGYRTLAKQDTDAELNNNLIYVLTNLKTGVQSEHPGRYFEFTPNDYDVGEYKLHITIRNLVPPYNILKPAPNIAIKIKVVDYDGKDPQDPSADQKGNIYTRPLFTEEKEFFGLTSDPNVDNYKVAYVDDVLSKYKYVDGYRADRPDNNKKNRFALFNDYKENYQWKTINDAGAADVSNIPAVETKMSMTNPKDFWNPEWTKVWLRHFSFGTFPKSAMDAEEQQIYDDDATKAHIDGLFADGNTDFQISSYQRGVVWLAPTNHQGHRINNLMKTIIDFEDFFNNHAFKGALEPSNKDSGKIFTAQGVDLTDEQKNNLQTYWKFKNGTRIIYDASQVKNLSVYQVKDASNATFVASTKATSGIAVNIGQDLKSIKDYVDTREANGETPSFKLPAIVTSYNHVYAIRTNHTDPALDADQCPTQLTGAYAGLGEDTDGNHVSELYNVGAGNINTRNLVNSYPNMGLNLGIGLRNIEVPCGDGTTKKTLHRFQDLDSGSYDDDIQRLIKFCKSRPNQTIYLRLAYEFDLIFNKGYHDPTRYKQVYRYIVQMFRDNHANNVKFVWQASVNPINYVNYLAYVDGLPGFSDNFDYIPHDPWELDDWYPGDSYVDIVGLSYFGKPDFKGAEAVRIFTASRVKTQKQLMDKLLNIARNNNKPVMIAECTPQGYDLTNLTKSHVNNFWDGPVYTTWSDDNPSLRVKAGTVSVTPQDIWNDFYQPLFDYIDENSDVIKYFHYINTNWASDESFSWTNEYEYWGDSRIQANNVIKQKWQIEMNKPRWIHGTYIPPFDNENPLEVTNITATSALFSWPAITQIPVKTLELNVVCKNGGCQYAEPNLARTETQYDGFTELLPDTEYIATLHLKDYFGKIVRSISTPFTTTTSGTGARLLNSNLPKNNSIVKGFNIYPNPTSGELNIIFGLDEESNVLIELLDINGRILFYESQLRPIGNHKFRFNNLRNNASLPNNGVCLIRITTNKSQTVKKIILK